MIRYSLKCTAGHGFESWFQSASAFDALQKSGHLECPACGTSEVTKAMMAPRVAGDATASAPETSGAVPAAAGLPTDLQKAVEGLRKVVEENSDYVGRGFASEARSMHDGEKPMRAIHGEANAEEARALLADGVPVLPLPFRDRRGTN